MVNVHTASTALLEFIRDSAILIAQQLSRFEGLLRDQLLTIGLSPLAQTVVMVAVVAFLAVTALRLFAGLLRFAVVLVLLLVALHLVAASARG